MKTLQLIIFIVISINVFGQRKAKYDPSLEGVPMEIRQYYVSKVVNGLERSAKARNYVGFVGSKKGYFVSSSALGLYFNKVPKAYRIYKSAKHNMNTGKAIGWLGAIAGFTMSGIMHGRNSSTVFGIGGLLCWPIGFGIAAGGRRKIPLAVEEYNKGLPD